MSKKENIQIFTAVLENTQPHMDAAFVSIPFNVQKLFGTKGHIKVEAKFDGHLYRGILANMGTGCHVILVRKDIRKAIGKQVGDIITVELKADTKERIVSIPADLMKELRRNKMANTFFQTLSYTNKKEFTVWIESAKKSETRLKRLSLTIQKLLEGKKNPSSKS